MEFLFDYGLFLAKTLTLVIAVLAVIVVAAAVSKRAASAESLEVEDLNAKFRRLANSLKSTALGKSELKALLKSEKRDEKQARRDGRKRPRTFVLDFKGDIRATRTAALREEISAIISTAEDGDEVVLRLENPGGVVHEHGLAASQLVRLRDAGIPLTVVVDKVAASGGYLMACVADRIVAAPFAILGSIGVLAQMPNFNRLLERHGVDFEQITAGRHKRTVTMFGKNTDEDRAKLREELEDIHSLFKDIVARYRPDLDIEKVATGEHWYGRQALELKLADELATSDQVLVGKAGERDLFRLDYKTRPTLRQKLLGSIEALLSR